jgi:hypothetical protein
MQTGKKDMRDFEVVPALIAKRTPVEISRFVSIKTRWHDAMYGFAPSNCYAPVFASGVSAIWKRMDLVALVYAADNFTMWMAF